MFKPQLHKDCTGAGQARQKTAAAARMKVFAFACTSIVLSFENDNFKTLQNAQSLNTDAIQQRIEQKEHLKLNNWSSLNCQANKISRDGI